MVHDFRVGTLCYRFGEFMYYPKASCRRLFIVGSYHDVGKGFIAEEIINKPGPLTTMERKIMEEHSMLGANFLKQFNLSDECIKGVLYHHTCKDGGYPRQAYNKVPDVAKLINIVDVFDAVTSPRIYRSSYLTHDEALDNMVHGMYGEMDKILLEEFVSFVREKGWNIYGEEYSEYYRSGVFVPGNIII